MRIAIIGYGKMGREIEKQATDLGFTVSKILDFKDNLDDVIFDKDEVAIEFTTPNSCIDNVRKLAQKGVNIVIGTTGWYDKLDEVENIAKEYNVGILYASNFSIGVHIFWKILAEAGKIINKAEDYDIMVHEFHHKMKKDSPSGTAITTSKILLDNIDRKDKIVTEALQRPIEENEIHVSSTRGGNIFGIHNVYFDSLADEIKISHKAKGRQGFAKGAVLCSKWLKNKKGFFTINDYIKEML